MKYKSNFTVYEDFGYSFLISFIICLIVFYWFLFGDLLNIREFIFTIFLLPTEVSIIFCMGHLSFKK